jgi:putative endonuclease
MPYVYMLKCSDETYYTGWTTDLDKRLRVHNTGKGAKYTRARLPVELAYHLMVEDKSNALKEEYRIKHLSRKQKEILVQEYERTALLEKKEGDAQE